MKSDIQSACGPTGADPVVDDSGDHLDTDIYFYGRPIPQHEDDVAAFNASELEDMRERGFRPRELHIQVSRRCNMQCVMCSWQTWQSNTGFMTRSLFRHTLEQARSAGVGKLVFANAQGEPFLHPDILELIEEAVAAGFWTMVSTNGTPFTPERIERLAASGIHNIQFSYGGYDQTSYETVYVGGKWEQVVRNLRELAAALDRHQAATTLVINGCYARELEPYVDANSYLARTRAYLRSLGLEGPRIQLRLQLPHNFGGNIHTRDNDALRPLQSHYRVSTGRPGLCRVLKNAPGVYHDGRVTACGCLDPNGDLQIGDLTQSSLTEIRNGAAFQDLLDTFVQGEIERLPLCRQCDVPYYENPDESPYLWPNLVRDRNDPLPAQSQGDDLFGRLQESLQSVLKQALARLPNAQCWDERHRMAFIRQMSDLINSKYERIESAAATRLMIQATDGSKILQEAFPLPIRRLGLAPATKIVLENLDWFQERFDTVLVGDNFKSGQVHHGQTVLTVEALLAQADSLDAILLTTETPEIESEYLRILPPSKTITITDLTRPIIWRQGAVAGLARARRILAEIEAAPNPLVVLGAKLLATAEPTFVALESAGFDVFVVSLWDRMENRQRSGHDDACEVARNVIVSTYEQLYILTHLRKGRFWIYYDFFFNTGWDAANSVITYGYAATLINLASRPVILGMYDAIKPVCRNMDQQHEAFALYKVMLDLADAVVLTSKSDHIAEYLRNTLVKDRPVYSFYRYSFPPRQPLPRLSDQDGERHLVGVTSFLGEVYEPNRIETRNSIRSMLRQGIHFHYYSDNPKVHAFRDELPAAEQPYFHIETPIWDQRQLVLDMSRFDGGWLVGDEATTFARLIYEVEDRHIREVFTLFVPNGVPTSSMTYGAAGLPVFISRQIKVMDEVYPPGCCIPLDMGEVDHLSVIFQRLDWQRLHRTMREERRRFDIYAQIGRLAAFIDSVEPARVRLAP